MLFFQGRVWMCNKTREGFSSFKVLLTVNSLVSSPLNRTQIIRFGYTCLSPIHIVNYLQIMLSSDFFLLRYSSIKAHLSPFIGMLCKKHFRHRYLADYRYSRQMWKPTPSHLIQQQINLLFLLKHTFIIPVYWLSLSSFLLLVFLAH